MPDTVFDVEQADFADEVVERSREQPVVVDFWAEWCGPCRTLGPMLEEAVEARGGTVRLAKVDVDANPALAGQFGVRGIPAVKGFRDGEVVAEFTGAVPGPQIEAFLDELVPSEADEAAARGRRLADDDPGAARKAFEAALDHEPDHRAAAVGLARLVVDDDPDRAEDLARPHRPDADAEAVLARVELRRSGADDLDALRDRLAGDGEDPEARLLLGRALAADDEHEEAVEHLLAAVRLDGGVREPAREQLVNLFTALGDDHPLVQRTRPRLARALF